MNNRTIEIAANLLKTRETMSAHFGERYPDRIREPKQLLKETSAKEKGDTLSALLKLLTTLRKAKPDSDIEQALLISAAYDLIQEQRSAKHK